MCDFPHCKECNDLKTLVSSEGNIIRICANHYRWGLRKLRANDSAPVQAVDLRD